MRTLFTSESVTEGHPDKVCDQISDAVLDALLARDPMARVRVPIGEVVEVLDETNETWWYVLYLKTTGYMMREFLREQDG